MNRGTRIASMLIAGVCLAGSYLPMPVSAAQNEELTGIVEMRATKDFSVSVSAGAISSLKNVLPLAAGEGVSIQAYYSPADADVEFGLISPDGVFHYVSASGGHVDVSITADSPGDHKFAIHNNGSLTITVSGQIRY